MNRIQSSGGGMVREIASCLPRRKWRESQGRKCNGRQHDRLGESSSETEVRG